MRLTAFEAPRDHQEDEDQVEDRAEVDLGVEDPQLEHRVEARPPGRRDPPQPDRERDLDEQLPARGEAERAPLGDLDEVVGEAERRAAERDAEDGQALGVAFGEHQVGDADRGEDDQPAHRRRARLRVVLLRAPPRGSAGRTRAPAGSR